MNKKTLEIVQTQALAMGVKIKINHYDHNRYSVTVKKRVYTNASSALSAITTQFLKPKKAKKC